MPPVPKGGTVAVTGASGYIGGWVVRLLLDKGYRVKACVRDANDNKKVKFLKSLPGYATKRLTLHSCDIDVKGAFDDVFPGCHGVIHTAADLFPSTAAVLPEKYRKNQQYITESINKSKTVSRLIYTSSVAAVLVEADMRELIRRPVLYEDRYPDESNPKRKKIHKTGYSVGKVESEVIVTNAAEESAQWDVIIANPSDNIGPVQSKYQVRGKWQGIIASIIAGKPFPQCEYYRPWMIVDVRECAEGHIRLLESAHVKNGERYILWSTDTINVEEIAHMVKKIFPEAGIDPSLIPTEIHGKYNQGREAELRRIWAGCHLRNDRIRKTTGISFRSLEDSLRDCVESLITVGEIVPRYKAKM